MSSQLPPAPQPQWLVDLSSKPTKTKTSFPDPPGYTPPNALQQSSKKSKAVTPARKAPTPEEMDSLKLKKAWELPLAPAKQLPMNAIGMYMSGNSLQIFSIMMVFMLFKGPVTAIFNINNTFSRLESDGNKQQMLLVKAGSRWGLWRAVQRNGGADRHHIERRHNAEHLTLGICRTGRDVYAFCFHIVLDFLNTEPSFANRFSRDRRTMRIANRCRRWNIV